MAKLHDSTKSIVVLVKIKICHLVTSIFVINKDHNYMH